MSKCFRVQKQIIPFEEWAEVYDYEEGQRIKIEDLINQLYHNAIQDNSMSLTPCEHYRDYIYIDDVVMGIEKLLKF